MKKNPYDFFKWLFSPTEKEIICDTTNLYDKLVELEDRIRILEECNVEQTNSLYECWNSLDARIDILMTERWENTDV